jgi:hypothetical protein
MIVRITGGGVTITRIIDSAAIFAEAGGGMRRHPAVFIFGESPL